MEFKELKQKIAQARELSKDRNFTQTFDLIINLQNLDLKKPSDKVDIGATLYTLAKPKGYKIMAIIDHSIDDAKEIFDGVLYNDELEAMKGDLKKIREITHNYDKFVVQANYMPLFAQVLGRYLGPMNKMPSPKLGMVINSKTPLQELYDKLQKTVHLQTKKNLVLQVPVGGQNEDDELIAKNIDYIYQAVLHALPNHKNNIKKVAIKLTMGKLVVL
jgi:large subunit ribosomal protein L1